jgi:hypothetical protein
MKLKSFCTTKETVCKLKRPPREWKKIFASNTYDKGLITKIYRELNEFNSPKKKQTMTQRRNGQKSEQRFFHGRSPNG